MSGGPTNRRTIRGVYQGGCVRLSEPPDWAEGTRLVLQVERVEAPSEQRKSANGPEIGRVIVAGFGPPGRWVGEIFDRHQIEYVIVDMNPRTIEAQAKLGRRAVRGDVTDPAVLKAAGIERASILLLTIPDEQAVVEATRTARELNPNLYIVARTTHTSAGLAARQAGADDVVRAEQVVARRFYDLLVRKLTAGRTS